MPASILPVKVTQLIRGSSPNHLPIREPLPVTICTALAGTPASRSSSTYRIHALGATDAGLTIRAFPITRAGMLL